jgi:Rrf2 family protein
MSGLFHINAKEHGALLLLEAIAQAPAESYLRLQTIAEQSGMSLAYLEEIAALLKQAKLIQGKQGPGGGYALAEAPKDISIERILVAVNGPLALVDCQSGKTCPLEHSCSSKNVWGKIQTSLIGTLRSLSLADAINS